MKSFLASVIYERISTQKKMWIYCEVEGKKIQFETRRVEIFLIKFPDSTVLLSVVHARKASSFLSFLFSHSINISMANIYIYQICRHVAFQSNMEDSHKYLKSISGNHFQDSESQMVSRQRRNSIRSFDQQILFFHFFRDFGHKIWMEIRCVCWCGTK